MGKARNNGKAKANEATEFGKRLRQRREEVGLTVGKLAQLAGLTEGAIRQMESGQTRNAILPNGLEIAQALGVSPWWLAGKEEPSGAVGTNIPKSAAAASAPGAPASRAGAPASRSDEAIVAAFLSRLSDPDDDVLDALLTRLAPYVLEDVRTTVQSAVQVAMRGLVRKIHTTDKSLLETAERLARLESARPAPESQLQAKRRR